MPFHGVSARKEAESSAARLTWKIDWTRLHHQWTTSRMPFGLLWITVDQAQCLRKTLVGEACEAMLRTVEQTLLRQMKPSENDRPLGKQ